MMKCLHCGQEISGNLDLCPACNAVLPGSSASGGEAAEDCSQRPEKCEASRTVTELAEAAPVASEGEQAGEGLTTSAPEMEGALLGTPPPAASPAQSPALWVRLMRLISGRIGSCVAILGSILMSIAFFLPWFLVMITMPSCSIGSIEGAISISPLFPTPLLGGEGSDWRTSAYLIVVILSLVFSIIVFSRPPARTRLLAAVAHMVVCWAQICNLLALSSPPSGATRFTIIRVLSGFWVGLAGITITLIGSIQMLIESILACEE
ncbi:hypothetical protein [Thermogemmatispora sp.]|uniref:hypothetical protein n=1 Tax=Thermogemmatispora sp. TaxID=1968838 RepID=UPI0035E401B3